MSAGWGSTLEESIPTQGISNNTSPSLRTQGNTLHPLGGCINGLTATEMFSSLHSVILRCFSETPQRLFLGLSNAQAVPEGKLNLISWSLKGHPWIPEHLNGSQLHLGPGGLQPNPLLILFECGGTCRLGSVD